jgi:hypothetical protein
MAKTQAKLSVKDLFKRFQEKTEGVRQGRPVHIPYTRIAGKNFLDIVALYYGVTREDAKTRINKELVVRPSKGGVLVFSEPLKKTIEKKAEVSIEEILGL